MIRFILGLVCIVFTVPAFAQKTSMDLSTGGSVIVGPDTRTCDGTLEGAIRYNSGAVEVCDGTDWESPATTGGISIVNCTDDTTTECALEAIRENDDPDFVFGNIASGVDILGVEGSCGGGFPPSSFPQGGDFVDCTDDMRPMCLLSATRSDSDPDFTAANIRSGVNILGVTGTNGCTGGGGPGGPPP